MRLFEYLYCSYIKMRLTSIRKIQVEIQDSCRMASEISTQLSMQQEQLSLSHELQQEIGLSARESSDLIRPLKRSLWRKRVGLLKQT